MRIPVLLALLGCAPGAAAQPEPLLPGLTVRHVLTAEIGAVRLAHDPASGALFYSTSAGAVYRVPPPYAAAVQVASPADHGVNGSTLGMAVGPGGVLYLTGSVRAGAFNAGIARRGVPDGGGYAWSTVAETEPYPLSNTPFDHSFNAVAVSPDGAWLFVNSGSRTDHGEVQDNGGAFPGAREVPLTSAILRVPIGAQGLVLPNDEAALAAGGHLYADGVRNAFDLAFDADGVLYATENAGDRDDGDELNRVLEGAHLGFPWRMGLNDTPQQFPGYDPSTDLLLNPAAYAVQNGFFYDDPTYPPPPAGVSFSDPVQNLGPDADFYRDPADGLVYDAGVTGAPVPTFTPHRSPLGLVFDTAGALPAPFEGDAFVLGWTGGGAGGSPLLSPFGDEGEDLLHLAFATPTTAHVTRLVRGFAGPIDAVLVDTTLYVIEINPPSGLWAVDFARALALEPPASESLRLTVAPNPAASEAVVTVGLPATQPVRVEVLDALGRRVALLHDGLLAAGTHRFALNARPLAAGVYAVRAAGASGAVGRPFTRAR